jgi:hypothetical protein
MLLPNTEGGEPGELGPQHGVVAGDHDEHHQVHDPEGEVAQGQDQGTVQPARPVVVRLGDAQREQEHRGHRREHHDGDRGLLGADHVGQPRVARPRPPQQHHDEDALHHRPRADVLRHERGHLREGEDEDQVEEQLERGDRRLLVLAAAVDAGLPDLGHPVIVAPVPRLPPASSQGLSGRPGWSLRRGAAPRGRPRRPACRGPRSRRCAPRRAACRPRGRGPHRSARATAAGCRPAPGSGSAPCRGRS